VPCYELKDGLYEREEAPQEKISEQEQRVAKFVWNRDRYQERWDWRSDDAKLEDQRAEVAEEGRKQRKKDREKRKKDRNQELHSFEHDIMEGLRRGSGVEGSTVEGSGARMDAARKEWAEAQEAAEQAAHKLWVEEQEAAGASGGGGGLLEMEGSRERERERRYSTVMFAKTLQIGRRATNANIFGHCPLKRLQEFEATEIMQKERVSMMLEDQQARAMRQLDKMSMVGRDGDAPISIAARMLAQDAKRWKHVWRQDEAAAAIGLAKGRMPSRFRHGMRESGMGTGTKCTLKGVGEGLRKPSIEKQVSGRVM
jgi:hypothetical protein